MIENTHIGLTEDMKRRLDEVAERIRAKSDGATSESHIRELLPDLNGDPDGFDDALEYLREGGIEFEPEEVEDMDERSEGSSLTSTPFDTSKIDIVPQTFSLDNIISRLENDEIDLMPDYQRKSGLWSAAKKSQLMESLMLKIPLPVFYFDGSDNNRWLVIDGLQRLTAIKEFFVDGEDDKKMRLTDLEFLTDLNGCTRDDIPRVYLRRMKETQIMTYIIRPGAPDNLKYNIFKRINTGGMQLEPQEIRHALYQGFSTRYLKELADTDLFREATCYSVKTERMLDREFALRFVAFYEFGVEEYDGFIDNFLNRAMAYMNEKYDAAHAGCVKERFRAALETSLAVFGKFAFRRMPDERRRRAISKALFEAWTVLLAKRSREETDALVRNKAGVRSDYMRMFSEDAEFVSCIRSGTPSSVKKLFEKINNLIERYAKC